VERGEALQQGQGVAHARRPHGQRPAAGQHPRGAELHGHAGHRIDSYSKPTARSDEENQALQRRTRVRQPYKRANVGPTMDGRLYHI